MPSFSGQERGRIEAGLRATAARLFAAQGLRKTTLDELVAPVGIVKSSFYAFFDSKESLYLELMLAQVDDVRARLPALDSPGTDVTTELRALLAQIVEVLDTDPLYRRLISHPDDMARVAAKLGPGQAAQVHQRLLAPLLELIERGQYHGGLVAADPRVVLGVLQAVLLVPLHADEFDAGLYQPVLELLIDTVTTGLRSIPHPPAGPDKARGPLRTRRRTTMTTPHPARTYDAAVATTTEPDLAATLFAPDRDAAFARLAAAGPVVRGRHLDGSPVWLVTGYPESAAVLADRRFSNDPARSTGFDIGAAFPDDVRPYLLHTLGATDPPDHTRLRRLISAEFTARRITQLRGRIAEITDELLYDLAAGPDEVDFIAAFAYPLPIRVICELLGVPAGDHDRWRRWSTGMSTPDPAQMVESARGLVGYITGLLEAKRRATPGEDDLLSALLSARDSDGLSTEELVSMAITILLAGHETTVNLLANALYLLLGDPERAQALRQNPDTIPVAVEEFLRYCGPADIAVLRYPLEPITLAGQTISPGEPVQVVYATANRDPRRFATPDQPDPGRRDNPHLGLGHGIHYCLGAPLARAEADIALRHLLTRYPDLTLAVDRDALTWQPGISRGLGELPIRLQRS